MSPRDVKTAYLRGLDKTTQCDLTFSLTIQHVIYGTLDQEIKSLRQLNDTVDSLLNHTKNKIVKLFQDSRELEVDVEKLEMEMNISLTRNDQKFRANTTCHELLQYKNKIQFRIFGMNYRVIVNAPLIYQLTIPKFIYANTCVKPLRLKGIHLHRGLSKYRWSKSKDKIQWSVVFNEINYDTSLEDVSYYLKLTLIPYSSDRTGGPIVEVISENTVDILPSIPKNCQQMEYRKPYTRHKLCGKNIRVVTYNILAERYTDDDQFAYCDPKFLSISYRRQMIFEELMNYKADIICLQEVDFDQYQEYFKGNFKNNDYIPCFYKKGNTIPEGLSLVFDKNRFRKVECEHIVLSQQLQRNSIYSDIWNLIKKRKEVKELFLKQQTSLLVAILKSMETSDIIIVANTHLYYHREAGHIRLLQVAMVLRYIKERIQHIKAKENGNISIVFCGDFNSRPDTAVYEFLTNGKVQENDKNLECLGDNMTVFKHNFNFFSACGTPKFTNYTDDFKGCLDYIFCDSNIKVAQVLPFPSEDELARERALPNQYLPSDHIALVVDLIL